MRISIFNLRYSLWTTAKLNNVIRKFMKISGNLVVIPIPNTSSFPSDFRCNGHVTYGIPGPEDQLLCREGYAVGYDYDRKVPSWVAYRLTPER